MPLQYFKSIIDGFMTLLTGLKITTQNFVKPVVTEQYPHQSAKLSAAYRSCIEFVVFPDTGTHDCIACNKCGQVCPSDCIKVEGDKPEGLKRKRGTLFEVDFALCSLCGLCIDVCPTQTLKYSRKYDEASFERKNLVSDLLADLRPAEEAYLARAREEAAREAAAKAAVAAAAAAAKAKAEAEAPPPAAGPELAPAS